jgi:hypothetical protein
MLIPETFLLSHSPELPETWREPICGVSLAAYMLVEAARLDGLPISAVLAWIGVRESAFTRAEDIWSDRIADALDQDDAAFDELYEDLLGRALSLWSRSVEPLDRDVEAWINFQRHSFETTDPGDMARRAGLTIGDEMRLVRLWYMRLSDPEIAARAVDAWSAPLTPLPKLVIVPFVFPPPAGQT